MSNIYTNQEYLEKNPSWHEEDSPWKATQIAEIMQKNGVTAPVVIEVGCGAGGVLRSLSAQNLPVKQYIGYDISSAAIALAQKNTTAHTRFVCGDFLKANQSPDLLLVIDVIEHVPDYLGFCSACAQAAPQAIFHIPLDLHVSSVLRARFTVGRRTVGHLHYFSAESALDTLTDSGYEVGDVMYTDGGVGLAKLHPSFRRTIANIPRRIVGWFSPKMSARLFGGYSLLVLVKSKTYS